MSRLSAIVVAAGLLLVAGPASAAEAAATKRGCTPARSKTIVSSKSARVFRLRGLVYGCLRSRGKPVVLASSTGYGGADRLSFVTPLLAGRFVAYVVYWTGAAEGYGWSVRVKDLRSRKFHYFLDFDATMDGEPDLTAVGGLALSTRGSVAWTWTLKYPDRIVNEVRTRRPDDGPSADGKGILLDSGPDLDLASLKRGGTTVSWINGGELRTAPLP